MQKYEGNVAVRVSQSVVIDPTLQPAGSTAMVDVRDVTPLVTTDNATVGASMERTGIEQLPINGRSITTLISQVPGIENQRAYGTRFGAIEYIWDGSQEEERRWGNAPQISLESLQEFRVDVNAVSAKYTGRPTWFSRPGAAPTRSTARYLRHSATAPSAWRGAGRTRLQKRRS